MALSPEEVAALVFKQTVNSNIGELALDGPMLNLLMQFDGKKNLGQIADQLGMNLATIRPVVAKLVESKLIQRINTSIQAIDKDFSDFLLSQMSIAIGPLASIVIDGSIDVLGYKGGKLPTSKAAELVNLLSREIPRDEKRIAFKQAMLQKIRKKGYM